MAVGHGSQVVALALVKEHRQKDLEVPCSNTHMCQDVRIISRVHDYDGLDVGRDFLLTRDLVNKKNTSSLVLFVHHVGKSRHDLDVATGAMATAL